MKFRDVILSEAVVCMFEKYNDVLTVNEACQALSIGKSKLYELLKTCKLKSIRIGKKYIIPKVYLFDYIDCYR